MSVISKISSYFERNVVTLKLRKEYLNTVTYNTPFLLRIKYWTVWYIERYFMSTYMEVSHFQKTVRFFWPTLCSPPSFSIFCCPFYFQTLCWWCKITQHNVIYYVVSFFPRTLCLHLPSIISRNETSCLIKCPGRLPFSCHIVFNMSLF